MISRLALYFGTTWQVNGLVISVLLTALLVANQIAEYFPKTLSRIWIVVPLLIGLVTANCFPFAGIPGPPAFVGALVVVVFSVPVLFAGLLFSLEFRGEAAPGAALGAIAWPPSLSGGDSTEEGPQFNERSRRANTIQVTTPYGLVCDEGSSSRA